MLGWLRRAGIFEREMTRLLSKKVREFAEGPNFAVLTTLLPDGHPAGQVMWIDCDDEVLLINTEIHRQKFKNVQRDPRVTVTIWRRSDPYDYVEVRGRVVETVGGKPARRHIDKLAFKYFDRLYDSRIIESERVILRILPLS